MPDPLCIGPCCQERDNNYTTPRMVEPGLAICRWGLARLRRDIQTTPALLDWLAHHIAPTGTAGERVSGSREAPVPVRLDILCMIQEGAVPYRGDDDDQVGPPSIPSTVKTWAWLLCEHRGIAYQGGGHGQVDADRSDVQHHQASVSCCAADQPLVPQLADRGDDGALGHAVFFH